MVRRFCGLALAASVWLAVAGCSGPSQPKPLSPEQERQLHEHMQQVQNEERSHFTSKATPASARH
jgi:Flp pilus assembly protein TadD